MKYKYIFVVAAVLLVAAACNKNNSSYDQNSANNAPAQGDNTQTAQNQTSTSTSTDTPHFSGEADAELVPQTPEVVEVDMTSSGFSPSTITIHKNDYIQFVNKDSVAHWPASNPHPTHTDLPGFDAKQLIQPGQNYRYQFVKVGTWGYHDHTNPSSHGTVVVQ